MKHGSVLLLPKKKTCSVGCVWLPPVQTQSAGIITTEPHLFAFGGTGTRQPPPPPLPSRPPPTEICFFVQEETCCTVALVTKQVKLSVYFLSPFSFALYLSWIKRSAFSLQSCVSGCMMFFGLWSSVFLVSTLTQCPRSLSPCLTFSFSSFFLSSLLKSPAFVVVAVAFCIWLETDTGMRRVDNNLSNETRWQVSDREVRLLWEEASKY